MTTPAVNINTVVYSSETARRIQNSPPYPPVVMNMGRPVVNCERRIRPQSATNLFRQDGTRPPSAWDHVWGELRTGSDGVSAERAVSSFPYGVIYEEPTSMPFSSINECCSAANAAFSQHPAGPFPYSVEAQARTKFLLKLQSGKADLGVMMAEMNKTVSMITGIASGLVEFVMRTARAVRSSPSAIIEVISRPRRNIVPIKPGESRRMARQRMRNEKRILDAWLTYQFGIKPLINDVSNIISVIQNYAEEDNLEFHIKVKAGASEERVEKETFDRGLTGVSHKITVYFKVKSSCHISAVYRVPRTILQQANELGLTNPAAVLWELIPFSWLVDYLTNTGKWLQSLNASEGASFIEGSLTRIQRVSFEGKTTNQAVAPWKITESLPVMSFHAGRMSREVLTSSVLPAYRPVINVRINLTRFANIMAVLGNIAYNNRGRAP